MLDNSYVGTVYASGTSTAGVAGTGEQTLLTTTIPAGQFGRTGQRLKIKAACLDGSNGNNKTYKLYFGSTSYSTGTLTSNAKMAWLEMDVIRTGSKTQTVLARGQDDTTNIAGTVTAATEDDTAAIVVKLTGQGGTSGVDCIAKALIVEFCLE